MHSRPSERRNLNLLRAALAWTDREVSDLDAGCFAIVMATGITSNAMFAEGQRGLSDILFRVNLFVYPWLVLATIIRTTDSVPRYGATLLTRASYIRFLRSLRHPTFSASRLPCADL